MENRKLLVHKVHFRGGPRVIPFFLVGGGIQNVIGPGVGWGWRGRGWRGFKSIFITYLMYNFPKIGNFGCGVPILRSGAGVGWINGWRVTPTHPPHTHTHV
jgi:hypothetical protein